MLTQCPECKTTFRLHVSQLKAAGGKVRCSRCNTTFDGLDNLFEATPPIQEQQPPSSTPPQREQSRPAAPPAQRHTANAEDTRSPIAPSPSASTTPEALRPEDKRKQPAPLFNDLVVPASPPDAEKDALSSFIDELEVATSGTQEWSSAVSLRDEEGDEAEASARSDSQADQVTPEVAIQLPPVAPPAQGDIIGAALDSFDGMTEGALPLVGIKQADDDAIAETFIVERDDAEPLVLFEPETLAGGTNDTLDESLTIEVVEEETLALFEPETLADGADDTPDESLAIEVVEEETLALFEPEALPDGADDTLGESLSIEAEADETLLAGGGDTIEDAFTFEAVENEALTPVKPEVLLDEGDDSIAETITFEELALFTDVEEIAAETHDSAPEIDTLGDVETFSSGDERDSFLEASEPALTEEPALTVAATDEISISDEGLNSFFAESAPEQGELLQLFEEEPDEEPALGQVLLPDDPADSIEPEGPVSTQLPIDPQAPFSGEQLEALLSPAKEQAAEEVATQQASRHPAEELQLDTGNNDARKIAGTAATNTQESAATAAPAGYAIPAQLTQEHRGSGSGTVVWGLGIVLMSALLALQYLYFFRLQLVENPQLRPLLTSMCQVTGCELPPRRDLGRIELTEHLMQFHPTYEQSLLITATLTNRADFDQPYPLLEVIMTDIEQQVVAHRHFTPQQYLPDNSAENFPANSELPLMLEVLDPGNRAVGFEFRFY